MVTYINFAVDDDTAERAKAVKEEQDLTWEEFVEAATEELA